MEVLMLNGSPYGRGCIYIALTEVVRELNKVGVETEILRVGGDDVRGCMGCGACVKLGRCVYNNDRVNEAVEKLKGSGGPVVNSSVHYVPVGGTITSFLDRFLYSGSAYTVHKPGAAVALARRVSTTTTLDQLDKYFMVFQMSVVSSQYRNMVYGSCPEDVKEDEEGMQTVRALGRNMTQLPQSIEAGKKAGISCPQPEAEKKRTNFIR